MKENYSAPVKVMAFMLLGRSATLKFDIIKELCLPIILLVGLQGIIVLILGKFNVHLYLQRYIGIFIPCLIILYICKAMGINTDMIPNFRAIYMAIACGTVIADGLINVGKKSGRKDILKAIILGIIQGFSSCTALVLRGVLWN